MKGGHGAFNQLNNDYVHAVAQFFSNYPKRQPREAVKDSSDKIIGYRDIIPELSTYDEIKNKINKQEEHIKELQEQIKELEGKMKNNSNTGSVNTFYTAKSKGGKRRTQKKDY